MRSSADRQVAVLAAKPAPKIAPAVRDDALAAIHEGYEETISEALDIMARVFAARVSADHIAAAVAYESGPIAKAMNAHTAELTESNQRFMIAYLPQLVTDAHALFCQDRNCFNSMEPAAPEPAWIEEPTSAQRTLAMPLLATTFFVGGHADLTCDGTRIGLIKNCRISHESPAGMGFGPAAQRLSGYYRMAPAKEGAPVALRVDYSLADPPAPTPRFSPRRGPAFDTARQITGLMGPVGVVTPQTMHWGDGLAEEPLPGVSDKTRADAIKVVDTEVQFLKEAILDQTASGLVAYLDQAQLNDLLVYVRTDAYQAMVEASHALTPVSMTLARTFGARAMFAARGKFCAKRDCAAPPPVSTEEAERLKAALPHLERVAPNP
jgi:hypothetical protein